MKLRILQARSLGRKKMAKNEPIKAILGKIWPFPKRETEYRECLKDLEERLKSKGVYIDPLFHDAFVRRLNRLIWSSPLLGYIENAFCAASSLALEEGFAGGYKKYFKSMRQFERLVEEFRRDRKKPNYDIEIIIGSESSVLGKELESSCYAGNIDNPDYDKQKIQHDLEAEQYRLKKEEGWEKAQLELEKLENLPEYNIYLYVQGENDKTKCGYCGGIGSILYESYLGNETFTCGGCNGSGNNDYIPRITEEQQKIAEIISKKRDKAWALAFPKIEQSNKKYPKAFFPVYMKFNELGGKNES